MAELVATTTGLTAVVLAAGSNGGATDDVLVVSFRSASEEVSTDGHSDDGAATLVGGPSASVGVAGPLGAQILLWQYATADRGPAAGPLPLRFAATAEPARVRPTIAQVDETPGAEQGTEDE